MDYEFFKQRMHDIIILQGLTPRLICECGGMSCWFYEGHAREYFKIYQKGCPTCGVEPTMVGDPDAPDL